MNIKRVVHGDGHTVEVTNNRGHTRKLPFTLPFRRAVELFSQLEHLSSGAGTIVKAVEIVRTAFVQGGVKPLHDTHAHQFAEWAPHDATFKERMHTLLQEFMNPTADYS